MKQIISILLSIMLLASSTGITYAKHFCGDMVMISEITLGEKRLSCESIEEDFACEDEGAADHICCANEYTQVVLDDNFTQANFNLELHPPFFVTFVSAFLLQELVDYDETPNFLELYHPPPLYKDIPVFYETFLI